MSRTLSTLSLAAVGWLALAAWDTRVITGNTWQAIYQEAPSTTLAEHTHVSDETFDYLDPSGDLRGLFGRGGSATLDVVDLNASFFRVDELLGIAPVGDDPGTEAEERRIPPPGLFSGLPDYSYGLYDWLNKNTTCPAFSDGNYAWRCHEFLGWLGAMNSVHFGTQATDMYAHQHRNAMALARRARDMRMSMTDVEQEAYSDELQEAELLALSYEGYAQHFLQDRWAMGHMWERWDAPDPQQEPGSLPAHLAIGALAGVIHGSEALINDYPFLEYLLTRADSMSSPLAGPGNTSIPMHYRHHRDGVDGDLIPGIGDERFQDALNSTFSLRRYDPSRRNQRLNVQTQMDGLMECAGAGWAEVIRELGPGEDGGFGIYGANIDGSAPDFAIVDQDDCWNMWATNESMMIGLLGENAGRSLALIAAADFVVPDIGPDVGVGPEGVVVGSRAEFVAFAGRLWLYGRDDPNGTQIARGEMTSFAQSLGSVFGQGEQLNPNTIFGFQEGGSYQLPDYAEPIGLITEGNGGQVAVLAENDARGRDVQTLYGAFTGAQSDYWCEHRDVLEELRAEPTVRNRELCERIAGRMYQGIHPLYEGEQTEERNFSGEPIRSMCQIRDAGIESDNSDDPQNPYWLDQGYLPVDEDSQNHQSTFTDSDAVANWCARVPVIALYDDEELRNDNVAAVIFADDDQLVLNGWDFGDQPGTVMATPVGPGRARPLETIISWRPTQVVLNISEYDWEAGDEYALRLLPAYETSLWHRGPTVGEFYLQVGEPPEIVTVDLDLGGVGPCMDPIRQFDIIDLGQSINDTMTPDEFEDMADEFSNDLRDVRAYFSEQLVCMQQLADERTAALHEAARSGVDMVLARRGEYYFRTHMFDALNVRMMVDTPPYDRDDLFLWQDIYATYAEQLQGTMAFLEGTDRMIQAWVQAYASDPPLARGTRDVAELMWAYDTVDEVVRNGFDAHPMGNTGNLPREMRGVMRQMSFFAIEMDVSTLSEASLAITSETMRGLRTWTQVQHALTQIALPELELEMSRIQAQAEVILDRTLSEQSPEYCQTMTGIPGCEILTSETVNLDDYYELTEWIGELNGGIIRPIGHYIGLMSSYFPTADGYERSLMPWPSEQSYQAAINGPGSEGTEIVSPPAGSPK